MSHKFVGQVEKIFQNLPKPLEWRSFFNQVPHSRKFSTIRLSTGQRKRLALIIALMEDKPIYVFDEWAADQDPHFRKYFYESLLPSLKDQGKLIIAVSHDDRYFHIADQENHSQDFFLCLSSQ